MIIQKIRNSRGFTLIELFVCIAILGIAASILIPLIASVLDDRDDIGNVEIRDQGEPDEETSQKEEEQKL